MNFLRPAARITTTTARVCKQKYMPARMYTSINQYTASEHLNPVDFHQYLQNKDREFKEFLSEEFEMIATESFPDEAPLSKAPLNQASKSVNEEFAKHVCHLMGPGYGSS
ncbi:hypothetical protein FBU59_001771 [Linderina macrospora]|uniref:Uncharacterized protein n=1 Tax=Linderina macrospora TaxID=4868 RepID=A0ACC1JD53_9FUNG|nr:hypothetical protein FBU59_001771 [Linderina macrospora]